MCILILIPNKIQRPNEGVLENCWRSNPDGAGFMYPDTAADRLIVSKGHMDLASLKTAFATVPDGVPVCVHFRIKTHGDKSPEMTHPHWVWPDETAVAHNGILPIGAPLDSPESDTARFARLVLGNLPKSWWRNDALVHLIEEYMGRANKLVAMNKAGSYKILNETQGTWSEGVWFSNQTFRTSYSFGYSCGHHNASDDGPFGYGNSRGMWSKIDQERAETGKIVEAGKASGLVQGSGTSPESPLGDGDPIPAALKTGKLCEADVDLLRIPIGEMTDAQWESYAAMMGDL